MGEKELSEFVILYQAARKILTVLRTHECGPPGMKGIIDDLDSVCEDAVMIYQEMQDNQPKPSTTDEG